MAKDKRAESDNLALEGIGARAPADSEVRRETNDLKYRKVTQEQIDRLAAHLLVDGSLKRASEEVGINYSTAVYLSRHLRSTEEFQMLRRKQREEYLDELIRIRQDAVVKAAERFFEDGESFMLLGPGESAHDKRADYGNFIIQAERNALKVHEVMDREETRAERQILINVSGPDGTTISFGEQETDEPEPEDE